MCFFPGCSADPIKLRSTKLNKTSKDVIYISICLAPSALHFFKPPNKQYQSQNVLAHLGVSLSAEDGFRGLILHVL